MVSKNILAAAVILVILIVSGGFYILQRPSAPAPTTTPAPTQKAMRLRSSDFEHNGRVPPKSTCDGANISPQLSWEDVPEETKSFALSMVDLDTPMGRFIHWLVYDIPKDARSIGQGEVPEGSKQVQNDFGEKEYGGPCPPSGTHRYVFTIYALDTSHLEGVDENKGDFFRLVKEHTITQAELIGLYSHTPPQ